MSTTTTRRTFEATATREGKWWIVTVPDLDAVTQARNVREINEMATGLVVALLDLNEEDVMVTVAIELPAAVSERWNEAAALHAQAEADEVRAASLRREALRDLLSDQGITQADAAAILGLSPQRVQQLVRDDKKVGSVGQVYVDADTKNSTWVTIKTGLFGTSESFAPLSDPNVSEDVSRGDSNHHVR